MFRVMLCIIIILKVFIIQLDACVNFFVNSSKNNTISKTYECNASKIHFEYSEGENLLMECSTNVTSSTTFLEFDGTVEWIERRIVKNITLSEFQNNTVLQCALRKIRNDSFLNQEIDFGQIQIIFHMKAENSSDNLMHSTDQSTLDLFTPITLNISSSNLTIVKDPVTNPIIRSSTIANTVPSTTHSLSPSSERSTLPTTPLNNLIDSTFTKKLFATPSYMPEDTHIFTSLTKPSDKSITTFLENTDLSSDMVTTPYETSTLSLSKTEQGQSLNDFSTPSNLATTSTSIPTDETSIASAKSSSFNDGITSILDKTWKHLLNTNFTISSSTPINAIVKKQSHPDNNMPVTPTKNLPFLSTVSSNTTIEEPPTTSSTFLNFLDVSLSFVTPTLSGFQENGTLTTPVAGRTFNNNHTTMSSNLTSTTTFSSIPTTNTEKLVTETTETLRRDKPFLSVAPTRADENTSTSSIPNANSTNTIEKQPTLSSTILDTTIQQFTPSDTLTTEPILIMDTQASAMDIPILIFATAYSTTSSSVTVDSTLLQNFTATTEEQPSSTSTAEISVLSIKNTSFFIPTLPKTPEKDQSLSTDIIPLSSTNDITYPMMKSLNFTSTTMFSSYTEAPETNPNTTLVIQQLDMPRNKTLNSSANIPLHVVNTSSDIIIQPTTNLFRTFTNNASTISTILSTLLLTKSTSTDLPKTISTDVTSPSNPIINISTSSTTSSNMSSETTFSTYYVTTPPKEVLDITTFTTHNIIRTTEKQSTVATILSSTETSASTTFTSFDISTLPMTLERSHSSITEVTPLLSTTDATNDTKAFVSNPIIDISKSSTTSSNMSSETTFSTYYVTTPPKEVLNITTFSNHNITTTTEKQSTVSTLLSSTETSASTTFTSFDIPTLPMTVEKSHSSITEVTPLLSTTAATNDTTVSSNVTSTTSSTYTTISEILVNISLVTQLIDQDQNVTFSTSSESPFSSLNNSSTITSLPTTNSATTINSLTSLNETLNISSPILSTILPTTITSGPFTSKTTNSIKLDNVTSETDNSTKHEEVTDRRKHHLPDLKTLLIVFALMFIALSCSFFAIYRMVEQNTRKNVPNKSPSTNRCPETPPIPDQFPEDYGLFQNRSQNTSSSTISTKEIPEDLYSKPLPKIQRVKRKDESMYANRDISNKTNTIENIPMETMYTNTPCAIGQQQRPNDANWIYANQEMSRKEPPKDVYAQIKPKRYRNQPTYANIPNHMELQCLDTAQSLYNDPLDN